MAESVFDKPVDNAIQEINNKIGTVPSGETVEGQIDALNSNITPSVLLLDYTDTFKEHIGSTRNLYYIKSGKVCIVLGYFYIEANKIPSNNNIEIANTGLSVFRETFFAFNDDDGAVVRSKVTTSGKLISEGFFKHKGWHSFSATLLLN